MKKNIIVGLIIVLLLGTIGGSTYLYLKTKEDKNKEEEQTSQQEEIFIKEELVLESGVVVPQVQDFATKDNFLSVNATITYQNEDEEVEEKDVKTLIIYLDKEDKEVSKDDATNEDGTLNEDSKEQEIVIGTGSYTVEISDNNKIYTSKLIVQDTTAPILTLKESVEITEKDSLTIENFVASYSDNSRENVVLEYVEQKTNENEETIYEKIENIDQSVGEREVFIRAVDTSNNETVKATKLKVNKKAPSSNSSSSSGSSGNKNNTGSSSGGTSSAGSSNGGASVPANNGYGSKGFSMSQSKAYAWWGQNAEPANAINLADNDFAHGAPYEELKKCDSYYGKAGACYNVSSYSYIVDIATGKTVGIYFSFGLVHNGETVADGYLKPGSVVFTQKNF